MKPTGYVTACGIALLVTACAASTGDIQSTAGRVRSTEGATTASVRVNNQNTSTAIISVYYRGRRMRLGPVEGQTSRTLYFDSPEGAFQFIIDLGDPKLVAVDAATGRVPCRLTELLEAQPGDTLDLLLTPDLDQRPGRGWCPSPK